MLIEQTLEKLNAMKLGAMAEAVQQQLRSDDAATLSFEDRLGLLVDAEWTAREQRKLQRRLHTAKLRYATAALEAVDFTHPRRLHRQQVLTLGSCAWIAERHNLLITGPTGIGKSFLACAFVERACRRGFTARYVRMPRVLHEVAVGRGDGSYTRLLARLAKLDLLAIDDWLLAPLRDAERRDLTEIIEDRAERASTLIASQLPVTDWHAGIGLNVAPAVALLGNSTDRASRCDEFINPRFAEVPGCTDPNRGSGAGWKTTYDRAAGILAGLSAGYRFGGRLRVEAEWFHRESAYDQTSPVTSATGDTFAKLDGEIQRAEDRIGSLSSQNVFANAYIDFPGRSRVTPYVGAGVGIGLTALDYGDLWARNPNPLRSARLRASRMRRRSAGTSRPPPRVSRQSCTTD